MAIAIPPPVPGNVLANAYACSAWVQSQYTVAKPKVAPGITAPAAAVREVIR